MWSNSQIKHLNIKQISLGNSGISVNTIINEALVSHPVLPPPPQKITMLQDFYGIWDFYGILQEFLWDLQKTL